MLKFGEEIQNLQGELAKYIGPNENDSSIIVWTGHNIAYWHLADICLTNLSTESIEEELRVDPYIKVDKHYISRDSLSVTDPESWFGVYAQKYGREMPWDFFCKTYKGVSRADYDIIIATRKDYNLRIMDALGGHA